MAENHLSAGEGVRGLPTYIKCTIPIELINQPMKTDGTDIVSVKAFLREGTLNIINMYIFERDFTSRIAYY